MRNDSLLAPVSETAKQVSDLIIKDKKQASEIMASLSPEEQVSLVSHEAYGDPKKAQEIIFLLDDDEGKRIVDGIADRALFRIMKSQSSTHIGVLSLVDPDRVQSILDLDSELFSTSGVTDPQTAYHWMVSFLEEDDETFAKLLDKIDIKLVALAFQEKIVKPQTTKVSDTVDPEDSAFPADFMVKLDRGELKPDDLEVTDEEALDILTKIHLIDEMYFSELVSLMIRSESLHTRTAEEALDRINEQVGDMSEFVEEAEDMFVPLEE
ncbi:MAG: hypothetical protein AB7V04_11515 [Desulfomonilaceae bacterium]